MEEVSKEVARSEYFYLDIQQIYLYGKATFGENAADFFFEEILKTVNLLESHYYLHPECRYLETKSKKYRNIILGSYLIIYRIKSKRIEVLRAFHSSHSPKIYKDLKKIKL